jgi:hypothetical protein
VQIQVSLPRSLSGRVAVGAVGLLLLAGVPAAISAVARGSAGDGTATMSATVVPAQRSRYDNGLGYVTEAAHPQAVHAAAQERAAMSPAPLIAGSGSCLAAMDAVRQIMHAVPSGGLLPRAPGWARLVAPRMGAVNQACGAATAQAFRDQEFLPWNNATIPTGVRIPPAPTS